MPSRTAIKVLQLVCGTAQLDKSVEVLNYIYKAYHEGTIHALMCSKHFSATSLYSWISCHLWLRLGMVFCQPEHK